MPFTQVLLATGDCADCAGTRDGAPANSVAAFVHRKPGQREETEMPAAAPCRPKFRRRPGRHPRRLPAAGCQPGRSAPSGAGDHGDADVKVPLHGATLLRNNVACNIVVCI